VIKWSSIRARICFLLVSLAVVVAAQGQDANVRVLVRTRNGGAARSVAVRHGFTVLAQTNLHYSDFQGVLSLMRADEDAATVLASLARDNDVAGAELESTGMLPRVVVNQSTASVLNQDMASALNALHDTTPVSFFGSSVPDGYVNQPAMRTVNRALAQKTATGTGLIIADIDNGLDPQHPAYRTALVPGFNFLNGSANVSVFSDLDQSTASVLNESTASVLNESTASVLNSGAVLFLDQSTASVLNGQSPYLGHGTEVAGVLHLVAPQSGIMPLKAFGLDGTGDFFNIIQAVNYAVAQGANVINMSFSCDCQSKELAAALHEASKHGVVLIGSSGNDNAMIRLFPTGYSEVISVGASNADDSRADFSNYGGSLFVVAPGAGIVTAFPGGRYAAVWGTSFSSPMVAGQAALLLNLGTSGTALPHAISGSAINPSVAVRNLYTGFGRIDLLGSLHH
jgi:subtilisin family serine protease